MRTTRRNRSRTQLALSNRVVRGKTPTSATVISHKSWRSVYYAGTENEIEVIPNYSSAKKQKKGGRSLISVLMGRVRSFRGRPARTDTRTSQRKKSPEIDMPRPIEEEIDEEREDAGSPRQPWTELVLEAREPVPDHYVEEIEVPSFPDIKSSGSRTSKKSSDFSSPVSAMSTPSTDLAVSIVATEIKLKHEESARETNIGHQHQQGETSKMPRSSTGSRASGKSKSTSSDKSRSMSSKEGLSGKENHVSFNDTNDLKTGELVVAPNVSEEQKISAPGSKASEKSRPSTSSAKATASVEKERPKNQVLDPKTKEKDPPGDLLIVAAQSVEQRPSRERVSCISERIAKMLATRDDDEDESLSVPKEIPSPLPIDVPTEVEDQVETTCPASFIESRAKSPIPEVLPHTTRDITPPDGASSVLCPATISTVTQSLHSIETSKFSEEIVEAKEAATDEEVSQKAVKIGCDDSFPSFSQWSLAKTAAIEQLERNVEADEIWMACKVGDVAFVRGALAHSSESIVHLQKEGRTPLYYACLCGHDKIAKLLLEAGATDPDRIIYQSALNESCRQLLRHYERKRMAEKMMNTLSVVLSLGSQALSIRTDNVENIQETTAIAAEEAQHAFTFPAFADLLSCDDDTEPRSNTIEVADTATSWDIDSKTVGEQAQTLEITNIASIGSNNIEPHLETKPTISRSPTPHEVESPPQAPIISAPFDDQKTATETKKLAMTKKPLPSVTRSEDDEDDDDGSYESGTETSAYDDDESDWETDPDTARGRSRRKRGERSLATDSYLSGSTTDTGSTHLTLMKKVDKLGEDVVELFQSLAFSLMPWGGDQKKRSSKSPGKR